MLGRELGVGAPEDGLALGVGLGDGEGPALGDGQIPAVSPARTYSPPAGAYLSGTSIPLLPPQLATVTLLGLTNLLCQRSFMLRRKGDTMVVPSSTPKKFLVAPFFWSGGESLL
jgi:hypothetical protein